MIERWSSDAPNTRYSTMQSIMYFVLRSAPERAPKLSKEEVQELKRWLTPVWDDVYNGWQPGPELSKKVSNWIKRHCPPLSALDKVELTRIDRAMRFQVDGKTPLASATARRHAQAVRACLASAHAIGAISEPEWPPVSKKGAPKKSERAAKRKVSRTSAAKASASMKRRRVLSVKRMREVIEAMGTHVGNLFEHEIGHVVGMAHDDDPYSFMYPFIGVTAQGITSTDAGHLATLGASSCRPAPGPSW